MPDVVRHKRFKDDVFWVSYNNPDTDVKVDFLSVKFPESERKDIASTLSPREVGLQYAQEKSGTTYETFVLPSSSILPLQTFKEIAARSLTQASGAQVLPSHISGNIVTASDRFAFNPETLLRCLKCGQLVFEANASFCPICGNHLASQPTKIDRP